MSTEESSEMDDVEQSLEAADQDETKSGIIDRLADLKDSYVDFHTVDEESDSWTKEPALGSVSRRGFLSLAGQAAAGAYVVTEAADGDGYAVDWSSGQGAVPGQAPDGGAAGPGGAGDGGATPDGDSTPEGIGTVGDVSDELYLQEDGTVIGIDHGHKEWRAFNVEDFTENEDFVDLYDNLEESREPSDLPPPGLDQGIEVTQDELFSHSTAAYDDMADEAEWDLIFDSNPGYNGGA